MYKNIIIKILNRERITQKELNSFISEYIYREKKTYPTAEQLKNIIQLIYHGLFNINYAAIKATEQLNLQITTLFNKNNEHIKTYVTE
ncbi:MAG: hypothetical protein PF569_08520 [Candidatus Woesearchaeota archaeon]|jgi:hypothetical protein|nr:hypothetical protein [Candidatus Woesearchaeota archaeon]